MIPLWLIEAMIIIFFGIPLAGGVIFLLVAAMVLKHMDEQKEDTYAG